jgi:predicted transcriptional regulator
MTNEEDTPEVILTPNAEHDELRDHRTLAHGFLSPRHRKLCQLVVAGVNQTEIAKELKITQGYVSQLLQKKPIIDEIHRLQDKIYESTVQERLKSMTDMALNNIYAVLADDTNYVKPEAKIEASKWVIEMVAGKATQKTDIGGATLAAFMDQLAARHNVPRQLNSSIEVEARQVEDAVQKDVTSAKYDPNDLLDSWETPFHKVNKG